LEWQTNGGAEITVLKRNGGSGVHLEFVHLDFNTGEVE